MRYAITLVTFIVSSTLFFGGCFDPNYNRPGGFTCKPGQQDNCPNDHVCCGGLCVKGHDCPQDAAVKDLEPDKDNRDGLLMVPINCDKPTEVSGNYDVLVATSPFDMVLDRNDNPHFAFVDAADKVRSYSIVKHTTYSGDIYQQEAKSVALSTNNQDHAVLVFTSKSTGRPHITYRGISPIPEDWKAVKPLFADNKYQFFDLHNRPDEPAVFFAATGIGQISSTGSSRFMTGRLNFKNATVGYFPSIICPGISGNFSLPRVASGTDSISVSAYSGVITKDAWCFGHMKKSDNTCPVLSKVQHYLKGTATPIPLASDISGAVHAAFVYRKTAGSGNMGMLYYNTWTGVGDIDPSGAEILISTASVDPLSVDIAADLKKSPCIAYVMANTVNSSMDLMVTCKKDGKWATSSAIASVQITQYKGIRTRIQTKSTGEVFVAFTVDRDIGTHVLEYATCKTP